MTRVLLVGFLLAAGSALPAQGEDFGFDPTNRPEAALGMYFVPENNLIWRMRLANGVVRQFERDCRGTNVVFRSTDGWRGKALGEGIVVRHQTKTGVDAEFSFLKGRLTGFRIGSCRREFPADAKRPSYPAEFSPLLASVAAVDEERREAQARADAQTIWVGSGRLQFPFPNPNRNGVFYASLLLLSLWAVGSTRRRIRAAGMPLAAVFALMLVMTGSRSSMMGLAAALVPVFLLRFRTIVRSRIFWAGLAALAVVSALWFGLHDTKTISRGLKKNSWSGKIRLELWQTAPKMMADAPGGWGFMQSGKAYVNWYQPLAAAALPGSMMNDHLTVCVASGRIVRFAYLFGWLAVLLLLARHAVSRKDPFPLGFFLVLGTAACFNPVEAAPVLWIFPAIGLAHWARSRPWRDGRAVGIALLAAAVFGAAAAFGLESCGVRQRRSNPPVRVIGSSVIVNGTAPSVWLVDDGFSLGGILSGKDVRSFYRCFPDAAPIGWVRCVDDLPQKRVQRVVLAGAAGDAWLRRVSTDEAFRRCLPSEVVFLSPPFPPNAIPPPLFQRCKVKVVVGELAAAYGDAYDDAPNWVTKVPGAELYVPGWMTYVIGRWECM